MNKLEKLKEINAIINEIIVKKETYIFVENIVVDDKRAINEPQQKILAEIKQ